MSSPNNPAPNDPRFSQQQGPQQGQGPNWNPYQPGAPYGQPPGGYPGFGQFHKSSNAATILVLGILSIPVCQPLGIAAWIMGRNTLADMDRGLMDPSERGLAQAGLICGIIGTVLFALGCLYGAFVVLLLGLGHG